MHTLEHPNATGTIIWLHGLGADCYDFAEAMQYLQQAGATYNVILPNAPMRKVTANDSIPMRAWYNITEFGHPAQYDINDLEESITAITNLIQTTKTKQSPNHKIILGGFSQGGAVSATLALMSPTIIDGLICCSTYLPPNPHRNIPGNHHQLPTYLTHGLIDPVLPIALGRHLHSKLLQHKFKVTWKETSLAHTVGMSTLAEIATWLQDI